MLVNGVVMLINLLTTWIPVPLFDMTLINRFISPIGLAWNFIDKTLLLSCFSIILSLEVAVWIYKIVRR